MEEEGPSSSFMILWRQHQHVKIKPDTDYKIFQRVRIDALFTPHEDISFPPCCHIDAQATQLISDKLYWLQYHSSWRNPCLKLIITIFSKNMQEVIVGKIDTDWSVSEVQMWCIQVQMWRILPQTLVMCLSNKSCKKPCFVRFNLASSSILSPFKCSTTINVLAVVSLWQMLFLFSCRHVDKGRHAQIFWHWHDDGNYYDALSVLKKKLRLYAFRL